MERETKKTMLYIIMLSILGMILMWFLMMPDVVSKDAQETYVWLQATQILFGF